MSISGNKDVDREILLQLPDKDILSVCSTNKNMNEKICDDTFFRNLIARRYPSLLKIKKKDNHRHLSWKDFFIRMIYYISYLEENFDIPYIVYREKDPEYIYRKGKYPNRAFYSKIFELATDIKDLNSNVKNEIIGKIYSNMISKVEGDIYIVIGEASTLLVLLARKGDVETFYYILNLYPGVFKDKMKKRILPVIRSERFKSDKKDIFIQLLQ